MKPKALPVVAVSQKDSKFDSETLELLLPCTRSSLHNPIKCQTNYAVKCILVFWLQSKLLSPDTRFAVRMLVRLKCLHRNKHTYTHTPTHAHTNTLKPSRTHTKQTQINAELFLAFALPCAQWVKYFLRMT